MRAPIAGSPPLSPIPGMMINPEFMQWRQQAVAWQQESFRRQQQFLTACQTIRRDSATGFKVDIEADSTVAADEQAEKMARTEFLTSIVPLLQVALPQMQQQPAIAPLIRTLLLFGVRAFPSARSLEPTFEAAFQMLAQAPPAPPEQRGNTKSPAEIASEQQIAQGEQRVDIAKIQADSQKETAQIQIQQQKTAADMFRASVQMRQDQQKMQADNLFRSAELSQQAEVQQARSALQQARMENMLSRSTAGLV
jgi:hypothetical protein